VGSAAVQFGTPQSLARERPALPAHELTLAPRVGDPPEPGSGCPAVEGLHEVEEEVTRRAAKR
jgi:hypothetical protein